MTGGAYAQEVNSRPPELVIAVSRCFESERLCELSSGNMLM